MTREIEEIRPAREVVGVFSDADALETAANELLASGFERARISLLAGESAIVEKLGHKYEKVEELEDNLEIPRTIYRSKEFVRCGQERSPRQFGVDRRRRGGRRDLRLGRSPGGDARERLDRGGSRRVPRRGSR